MHAWTLEKQGKHEEMQRSSRRSKLLASNSPSRVEKARNRQKYMYARHGEHIYSGGELRRLPLRADVAETHWRRKLNSPWRANLPARRVETEQAI